MKHANPAVDEYLEKKTTNFSRPICEKLREIYLDLGLVEEIKWGAPCYSHKGLVCSIGAFKKHVGSWFFKGSLLDDPDEILRKAQKNTVGMRSLYYTDINELDEAVVRHFVKQAMLLNEKGIEVDKKKTPEVTPPEYFLEHLAKNGKAMSTFENLAPSHRKEYVLWITEAKRPDTRHRRLRKMIELLEAGKGLNDKYSK